MAEVTVKCIHCVSEEVSKMGFTKQGKQRYICKSTECGRSFILEYSKNGRVPGITESIIDMAINGSGIRDTARVLGISQGTVIKMIEPVASGSNGVER